MNKIVTKKCTKCGKVKPEDMFHQTGIFKLLRRSVCKACHNAYRRERRKTSDYDKVWREKNKKKYALQHKENNMRLRQEVLSHYGKVCQCCGESRDEFMCIDHINGKGAEERRRLKIGGGGNFYRWLKKNGYPSGYRVLCHNCNMSIGAFGYCPHRGKSNAH